MKIRKSMPAVFTSVICTAITLSAFFQKIVYADEVTSDALALTIKKLLSDFSNAPSLCERTIAKKSGRYCNNSSVINTSVLAFNCTGVKIECCDFIEKCYTKKTGDKIDKICYYDKLNCSSGFEEIVCRPKIKIE